MRRIAGACHCGNLRYAFALPEPEGAIPVRACGCTFCQKHGGVYTSHPRGRLDATVADAALHQRYRFGHGTAEFHVCRACGVVPFVTSEIGGRLYAVVNVNSFEGVAAGELSSSPTDFDGETPDDRLARRQRNWIPDVTISAAGG